MSLKTDIQDGLAAAFKAQIKANNPAHICDAEQFRAKPQPAWGRWVEINGIINCDLLPKTPVEKSQVQSIIVEKGLSIKNTMAGTFSRHALSSFADTQYSYLNIIDNEKVKVVELKTSIRPNVAITEATIYHFDDEEDGVVINNYQDLVKFNFQTENPKITVKRLARKTDNLANDVVALQVHLLGQTKLVENLQAEEAAFNATFTAVSLPVTTVTTVTTVNNNNLHVWETNKDEASLENQIATAEREYNEIKASYEAYEAAEQSVKTQTEQSNLIQVVNRYTITETTGIMLAVLAGAAVFTVLYFTLPMTTDVSTSLKIFTSVFGGLAATVLVGGIALVFSPDEHTIDEAIPQTTPSFVSKNPHEDEYKKKYNALMQLKKEAVEDNRLNSLQTTSSTQHMMLARLNIIDGYDGKGRAPKSSNTASAPAAVTVKEPESNSAENSVKTPDSTPSMFAWFGSLFSSDSSTTSTIDEQLDIDAYNNRAKQLNMNGSW